MGSLRPGKSQRVIERSAGREVPLITGEGKGTGCLQRFPFPPLAVALSVLLSLSLFLLLPVYSSI